MSVASNPAPGFAENPEHCVETAPARAHVRVLLDGAVIAETANAVALTESGYPLRAYIPIEDVAEDALTPSEKSTYCRFKGQASYWSVKAGDRTVDNAAWGYHEPYDEVAAIADHVCFDGAKVDAIEVTKG